MSAYYRFEMNWDVFRELCETKHLFSLRQLASSLLLFLIEPDIALWIPANSSNNGRLIEAVQRWGGAPNDWPLNYLLRKMEMKLLNFVVVTG